MSARLQVAMGFDFVCPWCLIGLRELQAALAALRAEAPEACVELAWHGTQLLPTVPAGGWPARQFYLRRLGSAEAVARRQAEVNAAARAAGVRIDYERIGVMPNTADAHRLFQRAVELAGAERAAGLLEDLMTGYFEFGDDLGDPEVLLAHAADQGFERSELAPVLRGADQSYAGSIGAGAVPLLLIDGRPLVSGVVPARTLLATMRAALGASVP